MLNKKSKKKQYQNKFQFKKTGIEPTETAKNQRSDRKSLEHFFKKTIFFKVTPESDCTYLRTN